LAGLFFRRPDLDKLPDKLNFMKRVVIIGAGGHGREVADILRHQAQHNPDLNILGFVDEAHGLPAVINGLPILGDWAWFETVDKGAVSVVCAVGMPRVRKRLVERAKAIGLSFINAISPSAHISPTAKLGEGLMLFPQSFASTDSIIGDHAIVNVAATVSHDTKVGPYGTLNPGVHLAGSVVVHEGCYLGMGACVIQGVSIGPWASVGAGAVVLRDLPADVTAVGVPACVLKAKENNSL
jgi:sugar O-acyltransferase (sialic acid O-acetyltransferase NeuD family)